MIIVRLTDFKCPEIHRILTNRGLEVSDLRYNDRSESVLEYARGDETVSITPGRLQKAYSQVGT